MRRPAFVPDAGDVVWLEFDPQAGHEQAGHRPAVVLVPASYNGKAGMIVCCPVNDPYQGLPVRGRAGEPAGQHCAVIGKNLDWRARQAVHKGKVTDAELRQIRGKLKALIG